MLKQMIWKVERALGEQQLAKLELQDSGWRSQRIQNLAALGVAGAFAIADIEPGTKTVFPECKAVKQSR